MDPLGAIDRAVALIFYIGSAGVTAFLTALFISYGLGVAPAVLRLDALIAAGLLGVAFLLAMAISHGGKE
ncbi:hypothetical protein IVB30_08245 [Bradyrhizobium sp. 200]|uniref:hypothetical protein n=1 Tax=Bradyrhizobium sp. 200 TaxID=2782665 RepID=UPI001FFFDF8F|nr:hypothetical protein [Bradyrhizobium sp. 200]UPJ51323.1 hypothetical protein IVB30_08245 [Bradyrhizobium sp. 200]